MSSVMPQSAPSQLTWGLVIATKDRLDPLKISVDLALKQTRPPIEVVVADSSATWEEHRDQIGALVAQYPDIRFVYEKGQAPSVTVQRNQAVAQATADIVFMVDDDSFLYPDCAEEIMKVYEADPDGLVAGVQTTHADSRPDMATAAPQHAEADVTEVLAKGGLKAWFVSEVLLLSGDKAFYPYDGSYPNLPLPPDVAKMDVIQVQLFGGCRMTFRREMVLKSPFEPLLRYYCPTEDLDGSYRISRLGALVTAQSALMYHFTSASGRLNHRQVRTLRYLNHAVFFRKNIANQTEARSIYRRRMIRRIVAEALKDLISREFKFPRSSGVLHAWRLSGEIFGRSVDELEEYYPALQERLIKG